MRPALEVADVFRRPGAAFRRDRGAHLGRVERRVMAAIEACRTPALGGHVDHCGDCGLVRPAYNSCRNRHCPKCQGLARAEWLEARQVELLPVPYYHVVFTVPPAAAEIAFQNKRVVYAILFRAAADALRDIAADARHLGAEIGAVAVLHTWGQALRHHPHLHCIVPGGGLSPDQTRWVACRPGFFLPVRVLSRRFRTLFLARLRAAFAAGELRFSGALGPLAEPARFAERLGDLGGKDWVVFAKRPFAGPEQVLAYLGRYTHCVAIANSRLVRLADGQVSFTWKDYRHSGTTKVMTLAAGEFIRRFLALTQHSCHQPPLCKVPAFVWKFATVRLGELAVCGCPSNDPRPATSDMSANSGIGTRNGQTRFRTGKRTQAALANVGYARVSTLDQDLSLQLDALAAAGCDKVFEDYAAGARADREGLQAALEYVRDGEVLVVWKLDRLGRSLPHLIETVTALSKRGVGFRSLTEAIDTTTPGGRLIFHIFGALGQFERDLIQERTRAGLAAAAARGRKSGRKPVITEEKLKRAHAMVGKGLTVREIATRLKVGKTALYEALRAEPGLSPAA